MLNKTIYVIFLKLVFRTELFTHNLILLFYCIFHHKLICKIKDEKSSYLGEL